MTPPTPTQIREQFLSMPYQRERWKSLIATLFPSAELFLDEVPVPFTNELQKNLAKKIARFGNIPLDDGRNLGLYEVELLHNATQIAHNRVGLRNLLSPEMMPGITDGALICYFQPQRPEWRFSFFAKYYDILHGMARRETPPKRFTYVLGPDETCKTPAERFAALLQRPKKTIQDVFEAFSVEKVSKEFFQRYKAHYLAFAEHLASSNQYASVFKNNDKEVRDFVKKMLGRIVFLQFLQKKGWLDVPQHLPYGQGNKDFLAQFFRQHQHHQEGFYYNCLVPLFFTALNQQQQEIFPLTGTKFPYLNGGLFDAGKFDSRALTFPLQRFQSLFDFFSEYNFTIDESSPDDLDVGIDPEMLGHIFENLLEDNKDKGAFYTPKAIVQYMCQESIIQYLQQHLGAHEAIAAFIRNKSRGNTPEQEAFLRKNATRIKALLEKVKICDPAIGSGAFPMGLLQEIFHAQLALDWTIADKGALKRNIIQNAIYGVDKDKGAVDIARLRFWLSLVVDEEVEPGQKPLPLPNFDYKIMQGDSLFESFGGIDLSQAFAEENTAPARLANGQLDLFGNMKNPQTQMVFSAQEKDALEKAIALYFDDLKGAAEKKEAQNRIERLVYERLDAAFAKAEKKAFAAWKELAGAAAQTQEKAAHDAPAGQRAKLEKSLAKLQLAEKQALHEYERIRKLRSDLKHTQKLDEKPYFLWHIYFKDVLVDCGGFDIVIGNPPYIQLQKLGPYADDLQALGYRTYARTGDIYCLFYELGINLLREGGVLAFITSNSWMQAKYGESLRQFFAASTNPLCLLNFEDGQIFAAATVETNILLTQKRETGYEGNLMAVAVQNDLGETPLADYAAQHRVTLPVLPPEGWLVADARTYRVKQLVEQGSTPLKDLLVEINRGILTGYNEAFIIDRATKERLIQEDPKSAEVIKPIAGGRDLNSYHLSFSNKWILFIPWHFPLNISENSHRFSNAEDVLKSEYPKIHEYLCGYKEGLLKRNKDEVGIRYEWYALQRWGASYWQDFEKPKIMWAELSDKPKFAYDENGIYPNKTIFIMTGPHLKFLLSIFNSSLGAWYFNLIAASSGMGTTMWSKYKVEQFPIRMVSEGEMWPYEVLVDYIGFAKRYGEAISGYASNGHLAANLEEWLDGLVYELYFPEHLAERGLSVLAGSKGLLRAFPAGCSDADRARLVGEVYDAYKATGSELRKRITGMVSQSAEVVGVVKGGV